VYVFHESHKFGARRDGQDGKASKNFSAATNQNLIIKKIELDFSIF
jgi:hypothetical protein